ncbi:AraC family transcriptional regulator [Solimonas sp. K1W22B-7]|nr:AraC family transcriptional regulator [Solimonas sp. K1W22B-7]
MLPVSYLRPLCEIVAERGIEPRRLVERTRLTVAQLDQPQLRMRADEAAAMLRRAMELTGDAGLGIELGLRMQPTLHGCLGYALLSCASIGAALELMLRFAPMRQPFVGLRLAQDSEGIQLQLQDLKALGPLRGFWYESVMISLARVFGLLLGEPLVDCELWFDGPEPAHHAAYRGRLPRVRYGMPRMQLRLSAATLARRPLMADPVALRLALENCERERAMVGGGCVRQRVLAQMLERPGGNYPRAESVAARLCVSVRTLKRHLAEAGTSFRQLVEEARRAEALGLLTRPEIGMQEISERLGYQDPASFTRAFQRWSGQTPSQARQQLRARA